MQGRTILVLLLLAAVLGALVWMQQEEAASDPDGIPDVPAFAGVDSDRVVAIQIEHVERHWNVKLERDSRGNWYLTDPIAYRAAEGVVKQLLELIGQLRGLEVEDVGNPAALGLDPPRAVITVTERMGAEGSPPDADRRVVLEVGSVDLDGKGLFVRSEGRVLRVRRTLDNALAGTDQDFRSKRLTELSLLERPIGISRTGSLSADGEDLSFEAIAENGRWTAITPARVALDPVGLHLFQQQLFASRLTHFRDDHPGPMADYGLDPPLLRLEVQTARDNTVALRFGHPPGDEATWLAAREGHPFVWEVSASDARFFGTPLEDFYDYQIVRAKRSDIRSVLLEAEGHVTRLFRVGTQWRATGVPEVPFEELAVEDWFVADTGKVDDLLTRLEQSELSSYLAPGRPFVPLDPPRRLEVEAEDGTVFGGEIGAWEEVQGDEGGRMFRRTGDELVALIPEDLAKLVLTPLESLRTLVVHQLVEREQRAVRLSRGDEELVYELDRRANVWQSRGTTLEARDFAAIVDRLLSIRARRWLDPGEAPADDSGAIEVELQSVQGPSERVRLLRLEEGRELCEQQGRWAEIRPGLVEGVEALFGR